MPPSPTSPRSSLDFDPGIGSDPMPKADPAAMALVDRMRRAQLESQTALATAAVPLPVEMPQAAPDDYRRRNPSLPSLQFDKLARLPSAGLPYPPGTEISFRPYTLGESLFAEESRLDMRGTYDLILKGVMVKGADPYSLTLPDVLYIGLVRKIASLGDTKVNVTTTCPFCSGLNSTPVECTALEFNDLAVPALPIRVPFSFGERRFRPLTLGQYLDLLDQELESDFIALIASQCVEETTLDERIEMIRGLTDPEDIALVKQVDELLHHELKAIQVTCPQELSEAEAGEPGLTCGKRYPVALDDVSAAFVLPFSGRKEGGVRRQIAFGEAGDIPAGRQLPRSK